jgi:GntR family transcriptional regulator
MGTSGGVPPRYQQVAAALRKAITSGDLDPTTALPSEAELQQRHGVSRDTVRKALAMLTQEGLITTGQGRARYIRSYTPFRWRLSRFDGSAGGDIQDLHDAWAAAVSEQGRKPSETIDVGIVIPPPRVAEQLCIDRESEVAVVRRRVRFIDSQPYQLADSYYPEPLVRGTPLMEPRSVSAPGGVLAALGHRQARYVDEIGIRMPTADETSRLELPAATPVAEIVSTGYGDDGHPLRVMITIAPGDRTVLIYDLGTDDA